MPGALVDFLQMGFHMLRKPRFTHGHGAPADDGVHGRAHFMADGGEKAGLRPAALLCGHQRCLTMLMLIDLLRHLSDKQDHEIDEQAASREDSCNHQIRFSQKRHQQVSNQKENQQKNGGVE